VQESNSSPEYYSCTTGNVAVGAIGLGLYRPCKYFQPHRTANIGTPAKIPTPLTEVPRFLFDYYIVSAILNDLYLSIGLSQDKLRQVIRVSGHMEYTVTNQSNFPVMFHAIRWSPKTFITKEQCSCTLPTDPLWTTDPVYQGNPLNFLGRALYDAYASGPSTASNALNENMINGELTLKELGLWNEYMDYRVIPFTLKPGKSRKFSVGVKTLAIDTFKCFDLSQPLRPFTDVNTWAQAFIPGACGFIFRMFGTTALATAGVKNDYDTVTFTRPEATLLTKSSYTVYDWKGMPEIQGHTYLEDSGVNYGVLNSIQSVVLPDGQIAVAQVI